MKIRDEKKDIRNFGIILALILMAMGSYRLYYKGQWDIAFGFYVMGGIVLSLSLFAPSIIKPLYNAMMKIAHAIGWVNTRFILGIVFYLLFTPIAFALKLFGKDPLDRKIEAGRGSYWIPRVKASADKKRYERQF